MKKRNCNGQHEWRVLRELSPQEKRLTSAELEVKCVNCGRKGYVRYLDLRWMERR